MWHKPCRTFHPWCLCIKTRCLSPIVLSTWSSSTCFHDNMWSSGRTPNWPICVVQMGRRPVTWQWWSSHYGDVIMGTTASQITSLMVVYSTVYSDADQRKQSSASLAFVWGIHRGLVSPPHKWPVTRKMFPFDDVIMLAVYMRTCVPVADIMDIDT